MDANYLYDTFLDEFYSSLDPDFVYPQGDSFIQVDGHGSLLLLASSYQYSRNGLENFLARTPNRDLLVWYQRVVDEHLEDASLNVVDAIVLLGMIIEKQLTTADMPPFDVPHQPDSIEFLECLHVWQIYCH